MSFGCPPTLGWLRPAGGGVSTVNTDPGPDVLLDAGDIPSTGPSTVQGDLDTLAGSIGGLVMIDSVATLETVFPNIGGLHTVDEQTIWVSQSGAPFVLPAGRRVEIVNPGSIVVLGTGRVLLQGDFAGPLLSGELAVRGLSVENINAGGSDVDMESLAGRFVEVRMLLLGQNAGVVNNVLGGGVIEVALLPSSSGATGLEFDGTLGIVLVNESTATAPGGASYTAFEIAATATVVTELKFQLVGFFGALSTDFMLMVDAAATLPTGPLPTSIVGFEVFGCTIKVGKLFDPAGRDETDIRILSRQNTGGPDSLFLGDVSADTTGTPTPTAISQTHVASNTFEVIPSDNTPTGPPDDVALAETSANQGHTLAITSRQVWSLRYDGPEDQRTALVSWSATGKRSGGSATVVDAQLEVDSGAGFLPLTDSRDTIQALLTTPTKISGRALIPNTDNGIEYRLVTRTSNNATTTFWDKFQVSSGI